MKDLFEFNNFLQYYETINLINSIFCLLTTGLGSILYFKYTTHPTFKSKPLFQRYFHQLSLLGVLVFSLSSALYNTYTRTDNMLFHLFLASYFVKELLEELNSEK